MYCSKPKVWAMIGITVLLTGIAFAQRPSQDTKYDYKNIVQFDVKILPSDESASEEPNKVVPITEHAAPKILGEIVVMGKPVPGVLINRNPERISISHHIDLRATICCVSE